MDCGFSVLWLNHFNGSIMLAFLKTHLVSRHLPVCVLYIYTRVCVCVCTRVDTRKKCKYLHSTYVYYLSARLGECLIQFDLINKHANCEILILI